MPKRAKSHLRKMEILQFSLLASDVVWRARTPFYAINSNRFGKDWEFERAVGFDENDKEIRHTRVEESPSRKIFRIYLKELLEEKVLTRIKTNDKRSKFYSITPLGICHLIKSKMFYDGIKYPWPERLNVVYTLMTFAIPKVKPYRSLIFEGREFNFEMLWDDLARILAYSLREEIVHVFENFETDENQFIFNVTNGYYDSNIQLARIKFIEAGITVSELDKKITAGPVSLTLHEKYEGLHLDEEQFHHYLANLMICALVYDFTIAMFEREKLRYEKVENESKRQRKKMSEEDYKHLHDTNDYPEYFLEILTLFSRHISEIINRRRQLMIKFRSSLNDFNR